MDLVARINALATAIANFIRDTILPALVPGGGDTGQLLGKASATDHHLAWLPPASLGVVPATGISITTTSSPPTTPDAGKLTLFARQSASRSMLGWVGEAGLDVLAQPILGMNKVISFSAYGGTTTVGSIFGSNALVTSGNATSRAQTFNAGLYERTRRIGYTSNATAGSVCGTKAPNAMATTGDGAGLGGFYSVTRFAISDAAPVAGARMFVGMDTSGGTAGANIEPSTMTNCVGVGHGESDTNFMVYGADGTPNTPIDLGEDFPITSAVVGGDIYELVIFASPAETNAAYVQLTRLNTGHTAVVHVTGLPASTVGLNPLRIVRTNNATALAVAVDLVSFYYESDY